MGIIEDLAGGVQGIFEGDRARDQAKSARGRGKDIFGIKDVANFDQRSLFDSRADYRKVTGKAIRKGYLSAGKALKTQGDQAIRQTQERGEQLQSQTEQSLATRGLTNTTVLDNASRGISSDVSRAVADIQEGLGRMYADLSLSAMETVRDQAGRNLATKESTAWDWFKFTVGGAGFAPGESNAFGFQGSPYAQQQAYSGVGQQFGRAGDQIASSLFSLYGGPSGGLSAAEQAAGQYYGSKAAQAGGNAIGSVFGF